MSSIAGFTFLQMKGEQPSGIFNQVDVINRPGTDGFASRVTAAKSNIEVFRTVEAYTVLANANAAKAAYEQLVGTYVTVVNDMGYTVYNVLIKNVTGVRVQAISSATLTGANFLVLARWEFVTTQ